MSQKVTRNHGHAAHRKSLQPHARPSRPPPPLRRGHSYNQAHAHSRSLSNSRPNSSGNKKPHLEIEVHSTEEEEEESGMASFLQFCATCEKQIITPGTSILYCSEACRKKDVFRPASIQSLDSVKSPSSMSTAYSYFDSHPPADIVPQRSPTVLRPMYFAFSDLSIDDPDSSNSLYSSDTYVTHRPCFSRAQTSIDVSTAPSLINSPSSSYGTIASNASYRPLPPRQNPFTTSFSTKSIDIVIPCSPCTSSRSSIKDASLKSSASTLTSFRVAEAGDISYERRSPILPSRSSDRTRKQLSQYDTVKTPPRV